MTVTYADAALENIRDVVDLSRQMHEESAYRAMPFDMEWLAQTVYEKVLQPDTGYGRIAYRDGVPIGMMLGALATHNFGPALFAYDFAWYVVPEVRGSSTAIKLLRSFEKWAKDRGALEIHLGVTTNVAPERTGKMFKRLGYTHVGCNYTQLLS